MESLGFEFGSVSGPPGLALLGVAGLGVGVAALYQNNDKWQRGYDDFRALQAKASAGLLSSQQAAHLRDLSATYDAKPSPEPGSAPFPVQDEPMTQIGSSTPNLQTRLPQQLSYPSERRSLSILTTPSIGVSSTQQMGKPISTESTSSRMLHSAQEVPTTRESLNRAQAANLARFEKKLPSTANEVQILDEGDGRKIFRANVPAKHIPNSHATYEKVIDATGQTVRYTKTTFSPDGQIIHSKVKFP